MLHNTDIASIYVQPPARGRGKTKRMKATLKYMKLQQCAIQCVMARTSDAELATRATRVGELHCLHIAATMDVEETAKSLMQILEYKQELAKEMLRCSDEKATDQLADAITYSDEMIKKVLGMYVP